MSFTLESIHSYVISFTANVRNLNGSLKIWRHFNHRHYITLKNTGRKTQRLTRHLTSKLSEHFKLTIHRISKSTFMSNGLRFTKGRCFFRRVPGFARSSSWFTATCIWGWVRRNGGVILTWENGSTRKKTLFQCHFTNHKSHKDWPGIETGLPRWQVTSNRLQRSKHIPSHLYI
jgi:hypothetical protein